MLFVSVLSLDHSADTTRARYEALPAALDRAGLPLAGNAPIITDNPVWMAQSEHVTAVALPEEPPQAVLALARHFGARLLIVADANGDREWPGILESGGDAARCFQEVHLTDNSGESPPETSPLAQLHVFRIACP
jgi:hypothetical protein